jgi:hypothetical protein
MKYSIIIISLLALAIFVSGCTKQVQRTTETTTQNSNPSLSTTDVAADDLSQDITAVDNPSDPGTLDDVPVSESVPQ